MSNESSRIIFNRLPLFPNPEDHQSQSPRACTVEPKPAEIPSSLQSTQPQKEPTIAVVRLCQPLTRFKISTSSSDQACPPNTITCRLHPLTSSIVSRRSKPPVAGHVFVLESFVRGDGGRVKADGEFRRIVGLGRFLDSGARATKPAGGQVDSRVSAFLNTLGSSWVLEGHGDWIEVVLMNRRRTYSVRGMPMKTRQRRTRRFGRRFQRDQEPEDDVDGAVEET